MATVSVKCLCGSGDARLLRQKDGFAVVECTACRHVYVNPRLDEDALSALYNENRISPMQYYLETSSEDAMTFERRLKLIECYARRGRLLDVGCSVGTFMRVAKAHGWDAVGVDINAGAVAAGRKNGLDCTAGSLKDVRGVFDVVVMNDFIEHVPEPEVALRAAYSLLRKGGVLFVATPNIDSIMAKLSGRRWLHLKPNEHLHYFRPSTLSALIRNAGFGIVSIKSIGRVRSLRVIIEKAGTYSKAASGILKAVIPRSAGRISVCLNPGDEMAVIARK